MTKDQTQIIKGIAILLMLFLHLFNQEDNAALCTDFIYPNDLPLCQILTRMANPVPFFIILSGYGLYAASLKVDKNRWKRIWNLLGHYWLILILVVAIGHVLNPSSYPGSLLTFIKNLTAFHTTYNGEWWFLFPYLLLAISSPWIFKICNNFKWYYVLGFTYVLYLVSCYCISKYGDAYLYNNMAIYHPILYISLVFNFCLGAEACKNDWLKPTNNKFIHYFAWALLLLICAIRCTMASGAFHNLFVYGFIWLFIQVKGYKPLQNCLAHIGKHSMNMWLVHSFFCYYFFHDWIYGFKYPILIYMILISVSYSTSVAVNFIYQKINDFRNHSSI